jgi:dTDP-4-amino-4,6-dideoxygalactose transaminase
MSGQEQQYVQDAFATNWIAPLGPHVNAFEQEFAPPSAPAMSRRSAPAWRRCTSR